MRLFTTGVSAAELAAPILPDPVISRPIAEPEQRPFHTVLPSDVTTQRIFFQSRLWHSGRGEFPRLGVSDIGKRLTLVAPDQLQLETLDQLISRTAAFTKFPRGGDAVRLRAPWKFSTSLKLGDYGFIDGAVNEEYTISVDIIFNSVPFIDEAMCSASGGPPAYKDPRSVPTPIRELTATEERAGFRCWNWKDGHARAHNGFEYIRVCRVWDWYPEVDE